MTQPARPWPYVAIAALFVVVMTAATAPTPLYAFWGRRYGFGSIVTTLVFAIYAVGFGVLFNFIAAFTYVSFHLAGPPYFFSPTLLGALFATYLAGSFTVPWVGRAVVILPLQLRHGKTGTQMHHCSFI